MEINLKKYKLPEQYKRKGKHCFLDPYRNKLILKTPEEVVRQKVSCFIQDKMCVPNHTIELEVPMSHFKKGAKGRADIVVFDHKDRPVFVVECKAKEIELTNDVLFQAARYEKACKCKTFAYTNGEIIYFYNYDEKISKYRKLAEAPTYKTLCRNCGYKYVEQDIGPWERPDHKKISSLTLEEIDDLFDQGLIGEGTDQGLWSFIVNLAGCVLDDSLLVDKSYCDEIEIVRDIGIYFTEFGNASGGKWPGFYRSFLIKDTQGENQIVSLTLGASENRHSYFNVAIDDFENRHLSLQLNLDKYVEKKGVRFKIWHNGTLNVGNRGMAKRNEVIQYIKEKEPNLVDNSGNVFLGEFSNKKRIEIHDTEMKKFVSRIITYSLVRDEFRKMKKRK